MSAGWEVAAAGRPSPTRQLVLNSDGNCTGCSLPPPKEGSIGAVLGTDDSGFFACAPTEGDCGVKSAAWPTGTERGLPEWYKTFLSKRAGSP